MKIAKFPQNFEKTMLSLIEYCRISTKFDNDYGILNKKVPNFDKIWK